ncbi:peptide methionine sulfoxide reductase msrA [Vibrio sp. JCM 19236]|nr:peptide methionine sulfoxide reductase msrA [Vibrio sp. JCM 19236]
MKRFSKLLIVLGITSPLAWMVSTASNADSKGMPHSGDTQIATLAGGCFWCTESDLEKLPGVIDVVSGYAGGTEENPTYKQVASGKTSHIETIQVTYDPEKVTYVEVLDQFFRHIDPTDDKARLSTVVHIIALLCSITTQNRSRLLQTSCKILKPWAYSKNH